MIKLYQLSTIKNNILKRTRSMKFVISLVIKKYLLLLINILVVRKSHSLTLYLIKIQKLSLSSCMRQLKLLKISRKALMVAIPKPNKPLMDPKKYIDLSLCFASPSRFWRNLSTLVRNQS